MSGTTTTNTTDSTYTKGVWARQYIMVYLWHYYGCRIYRCSSKST